MAITTKSIMKVLLLGTFILVAGFAYYLFFVDHRKSLGLDIGEFFNLNSSLEIQFNNNLKETSFVAMNDDVKLAVDAFIPTDGTGTQEKFPVIFFYGPYGRSHIVPEMTLLEKIGTKLKTGFLGPVFDRSSTKKTRIYLSQGYAYVAADMRGTGASEGYQVPLDPLLGTDGKALVDWIAQQPWSNGKVCMESQSYNAWSQFATAQHKPEALKCIIPALIAFDSFTEGSRPGGIAAARWLEEYSEHLAESYSNSADKKMTVTPAVDEDGDGDLADEVPIKYNGDTPVYFDHDKRTNHYYAKATADHKNNMLVAEFLNDTYSTIDSEILYKGRRLTSYETSPGYFLKSILETDIAVYNVGGWFDGFLKGTTKLYATMQNSVSSKMFIAPRFHGRFPEAYREYLQYKGDYADQLILESLRFFDYHLKGIENGVGSEEPVKIYVMHDGWRKEKEWPLARQEMTPFYFGAGQSLSPIQNTQEGVDAYEVNWMHQANYGSNNANRWVMMLTPDEMMDRTEQDNKTYYYETAPLEEDMEVTGHPIINMWLSANHDDADVHAYLTDVDESGRSIYVTEGHQRAAWAGLFDDDEQVLGVVDVKPDLPWHGYKLDQYDDKRLADGKVVNLKFDMEPTSWLFKKGHKIRVAIAGVDKDNFELNETVCPEKDIVNCKDTVLSIHRSEGMLSNIELPIIPKKRQ